MFAYARIKKVLKGSEFVNKRIVSALIVAATLAVLVISAHIGSAGQNTAELLPEDMTLTRLELESFEDTKESMEVIVESVSVSEEQQPSEVYEEATEEEDNEYSDLALAHVTNYVNIRSGPNTDSEVVGKIYDGAVAQILETAGEENDWFKIVSGNVEGYIKSEFFYYGQAASENIEQYVTRYANVIADRLNIRENPEVESKRIGYIDFGEKAKIVENLGEWTKVQYTDSKVGYVASEYITVSEEFVYAKTLAEEAAEIAAKKALEERAKESETKKKENTTVKVTPPSSSYETTSDLRKAIVDYAMQFLGNKYVHGGNSLTTGTDCSGFTSLIYADFGYSVSRTPSGQLANNGSLISYSDAQPGDIICYGKSSCTHVALYLGNGEIIHAANSKKGVVIYKADYDNILGVKNIID